MEKPQEQINTRPAPIPTRLNETLALNIQKQLNRAETNKAVDIRVPAVALLTVNSIDRYKNGVIPAINPGTTPASAYGSTSTPGLSSPYDFTIPASASVMNGSFTRIALTQFQMLFTLPWFNQRTDGMYITYKLASTGVATTYLLTLYPTQAYGMISYTTFLSNLQTVIRATIGAAASGFTVVQATGTTSSAILRSNTNDTFYISKYINPALPELKDSD
jgi:hypothetical protein